MSDFNNNINAQGLIVTQGYLQKHARNTQELNQKLAAGSRLHNYAVDPFAYMSYSKFNADHTGLTALDSALKESFNKLEHSVNMLEHSNDVLLQMKNSMLDLFADFNDMELQADTNKRLEVLKQDLNNVINKNSGYTNFVQTGVNAGENKVLTTSSISLSNVGNKFRQTAPENQVVYEVDLLGKDPGKALHITTKNSQKTINLSDRTTVKELEYAVNNLPYFEDVAVDLRFQSGGAQFGRDADINSYLGGFPVSGSSSPKVISEEFFFPAHTTVDVAVSYLDAKGQKQQMRLGTITNKTDDLQHLYTDSIDEQLLAILHKSVIAGEPLTSAPDATKKEVKYENIAFQDTYKINNIQAILINDKPLFDLATDPDFTKQPITAFADTDVKANAELTSVYENKPVVIELADRKETASGSNDTFVVNVLGVKFLEDGTKATTVLSPSARLIQITPRSGKENLLEIDSSAGTYLAKLVNKAVDGKEFENDFFGKNASNKLQATNGKKILASAEFYDAYELDILSAGGPKGDANILHNASFEFFNWLDLSDYTITTAASVTKPDFKFAGIDVTKRMVEPEQKYALNFSAAQVHPQVASFSLMQQDPATKVNIDLSGSKVVLQDLNSIKVDGDLATAKQALRVIEKTLDFFVEEMVDIGTLQDSVGASIAINFDHSFNLEEAKRALTEVDVAKNVSDLSLSTMQQELTAKTISKIVVLEKEIIDILARM